jgi:hypothetical protein
MRGNKLHLDRTKKDTRRGAALAKGGTTKMFGKQAAGPDKPGNTGKDQSKAPGAKFAKGGEKQMHYRPSVPAKPGIAGAR